MLESFFETEDGQQKLAVVNIGDSRLFQVRNDEIIFQTTDQSRGRYLLNGFVAGEGFDRGHQDEYFAVNVEPGDRFMVSSDGVTGDTEQQLLSDQELLSALVSSNDPDTALNKLFAISRKNDDTTAIIIDAPTTEKSAEVVEPEQNLDLDEVRAFIAKRAMPKPQEIQPQSAAERVPEHLQQRSAAARKRADEQKAAKTPESGKMAEVIRQNPTMIYLDVGGLNHEIWATSDDVDEAYSHVAELLAGNDTTIHFKGGNYLTIPAEETKQQYDQAITRVIDSYIMTASDDQLERLMPETVRTLSDFIELGIANLDVKELFAAQLTKKLIAEGYLSPNTRAQLKKEDGSGLQAVHVYGVAKEKGQKDPARPVYLNR